ncbi:hypothetical protein AgCh_001891 [Apium graveolens]
MDSYRHLSILDINGHSFNTMNAKSRFLFDGVYHVFEGPKGLFVGQTEFVGRDRLLLGQWLSGEAFEDETGEAFEDEELKKSNRSLNINEEEGKDFKGDNGTVENCFRYQNQRRPLSVSLSSAGTKSYADPVALLKKKDPLPNPQKIPQLSLSEMNPHLEPTEDVQGITTLSFVLLQTPGTSLMTQGYLLKDWKSFRRDKYLFIDWKHGKENWSPHERG